MPSLSTTQKLHLLHTAVANPFTSKPALLSLLSAQHPEMDSHEIEAFLDDLVDFEAVQKFKSAAEVAVVTEVTEAAAEVLAVSDTLDTAENTAVDGTVVSVPTSRPSSPFPHSRPHSAPPSPSPSDSPSNSPSNSDSNSLSPTETQPDPIPSAPIVPTPSPPLIVPVRTPSGRTLRSNSTVNTSEPRRLRSNK